ncbi:Nodulation-signaling pathway 2 protein [Dendrobium catenatum]|uniref:Nodulation-signaling pathway 2 protein n=2 Tax=Dendrobium catenatum TaxID=906689 RepID=A0A2I0VPP4_9ASPA|nr:Nodulation-signaling pathway 2 protein [Dendrobium catenatum]
MVVAAMNEMMERDIFGFSSTNSIPINADLGWRDWSPGINWDDFTGADDFHGQIDSMMTAAVDLHDWYTCVSPTSTNCPGSPAEDLIPSSDDTAVRLVHLLKAAAESLSGDLKTPALTEAILARLRELLLARTTSTGMERLATHFTNALHSLLDAAGDVEEPLQQPCEFLRAFLLMQDMSPCIKFGHFTANQAILESVAGERRVHIVDFDIAEGVQWASLMQALVSINNGSPPPHLKITAVARYRRSVQETGGRLADFAASVGLPFSFGQCRTDYDGQFRPAGIKVVRGEALVFNCILQPGSAGGSLSFISGAAALGARVVTIVDEESEGVGFEGRFMEEMMRYSAIWDALDAGFEKQGREREMVERVFLGPRIAAAVERAYKGMEAWENLEKRLEAAEFGRMGLSFFNICQARLLLCLFSEGYRLEEGTNKLVLCWKSCRLISASVWSAPPLLSPEESYLSS